MKAAKPKMNPDYTKMKKSRAAGPKATLPKRTMGPRATPAKGINPTRKRD